MNEREKLIKELDKCLVYVPGNGSRYSDEKLADFILADRKRIVESFVKALKGILEKTNNSAFITGEDYYIHVSMKSIKDAEETLKNAGVE